MSRKKAEPERRSRRGKSRRSVDTPGQGVERRDSVRETRKRLFLEAFPLKGTIKHAAAAAAVTRRTVYVWLDEDPEFAAQFKEAREDFCDALEAEMYRRGHDGWEEPVFGSIGNFKTGVVGHVRKFSDKMIELLARANMRDKYNVRQHELTGKDGVPLFSFDRLDKLSSPALLDFCKLLGIDPQALLEECDAELAQRRATRNE